ncbi:MAG: hypothetical protein V3R77_10280 [Candidatus Binatia bacterium]
MSTITIRTGAACTLLAATAFAATVAAPTPARAEDDICKTWVREHCMAKADYIRSYLDPSVPAEALDRRLYEMLQLESYLLSCNIPEQRLRRSLVGWRLIGKSPDSFGREVFASAYAEAGLELSPRSVFGEERYVLNE